MMVLHYSQYIVPDILVFLQLQPSFYSNFFYYNSHVKS